MPVTRSARRAATRSNTKRTILSALDENKPAPIEQLKITPSSSSSPSSSSISPSYSTNPHLHPNFHSHSPLPDLDVLRPESIHALLHDIKTQVDSRQESLSIKGVEIAKNQQDVFFVNTMKIEKSIKKMTIRDFNKKFMNNKKGENDKDASIVDVLKAIMANANGSTAKPILKKRDRPGAATPSSHAGFYSHNHLPLETPVRQLKQGKPCRTPGTILRTVRKNEAIFSSNGSPVLHADEGDLIATVSKKRRGNGKHNAGSGSGSGADDEGEAMFDINIDGRTISLSDPSTMEHLTNEMKNTAKNQLNVLQDQLSKLLSHLN